MSETKRPCPHSPKHYDDCLRCMHDALTAKAALVEELAGALRAYVLAQGRMVDRRSETDDALRRELWANLNACEGPARAVLAKVKK